MERLVSERHRILHTTISTCRLLLADEHLALAHLEKLCYVFVDLLVVRGHVQYVVRQNVLTLVASQVEPA